MNLTANESLKELSVTELQSISGGDSVAHDIGETIGYFFGYLYTATPALLVKAATIIAVTK